MDAAWGVHSPTTPGDDEDVGDGEDEGGNSDGGVDDGEALRGSRLRVTHLVRAGTDISFGDFDRYEAYQRNLPIERVQNAFVPAASSILPPASQRSPPSSLPPSFSSSSTPSLSSSERPLYQWFKDGSSITNTSFPYPFYTLFSSTTTDSGEYSCVATSGPEKGRRVVDTIVQVSSPPSSRTKPKYLVVMVGSRLCLQIEAEGVPVPTSQWFKNGIPLADQRDHSLIINNVQMSDSGTYTSLLENMAGKFVWVEGTVVVMS